MKEEAGWFMCWRDDDGGGGVVVKSKQVVVKKKPSAAEGGGSTTVMAGLPLSLCYSLGAGGGRSSGCGRRR